jgi:hypothetical protein
MGMTLVVVGKNEEAFSRFEGNDLGGASTVALLPNLRREPLSVIGNRFLNPEDVDVLGLVHADTWFGPGALQTFRRVAFAGAVCGIVGRDIEGVYRWCNVNPGPVSTLDCCGIFFRRDLGLRFDEQLCTSFHMHAEDLCLQAQSRKIPVVVPRARAGHYGIGGRGEWALEYARFRKALCAKWSGVKFATT